MSPVYSLQPLQCIRTSRMYERWQGLARNGNWSFFRRPSAHRHRERLTRGRPNHPHLLRYRCSPSPLISFPDPLPQSLPVSLHITVSPSAHHYLLFRLSISQSLCLLSVSPASLILSYHFIYTSKSSRHEGSLRISYGLRHHVYTG